MKKMLFLFALLCFSCEERSSNNPPPKKDYTFVGRLDSCSSLLKFEDGNVTCYVIDYCGSANATISCVKNEVAPQK